MSGGTGAGPTATAGSSVPASAALPAGASTPAMAAPSVGVDPELLHRLDRPIDRRGTDCVKWDYVAADAERDVLPMWVADMDFPVDTAIVEALSARVAHPVYGYGLIPADWKPAIQAWQQQRYGWAAAADDIVYSPGVLASIKTLLEVVTEPGDAVIVPVPVYSPLTGVVSERARRLIDVQLPLAGTTYGSPLAVFPSDCRAQRVRALILCSPHNPVGRVWTADELTAFAQYCHTHDLIMIVDEIHADFVVPSARFFSAARLPADLRERVVVCQSPTKTFNIAGISSSHVIFGDERLRRQFTKALDRYGNTAVNFLSITAAVAGYRNGGPWLDAAMSIVHTNRRRFAAALADTDAVMHPTDATYLAWIDLRPVADRRGVTHSAVADDILQRARLRVNSGAGLGAGGAGFIRVNLACPTSLADDGLSRLLGYITAAD